ncbi:MAG TPA: serine/threonine-protein kinase, partial [Chthoniobacterales bacterium]|nr:serine/threonine-protein kinase [Chthoniobacterales bacterium]
MNPDPRRICQACGAVIPAGSEFCLVCALRGALDDRQETVELNVEPAPSLSAARFDHYQVLTREDGALLELGHGAMGVTYKAIDINLRCAVALKLINARYLGDESARRRFVREARAAASVRHPNVASVFHLGQTGEGYFYAMEYVEGETLENLIKRCGRLEPKVALEIARQVAAGLAAIHEQNLVHRDIKPTNIMVSLKDEGRLTTKIIDLGLAKPVADAPTEFDISVPGAFAGTPAFASPEQFAGVGVDIRSDLYSLGVVLWEMVTGHVMFRGSPAEVMYQHQHAPLPLERLKDVSQPVVVLLERLLEKDPAQRFQIPNELLKAIPTIATAIDAGRKITRQSLEKAPSSASRVGTRKPSVRSGPKKISVARLPVTGGDLFGRDEDIAFLDSAWANQDVNVVTIVAWAGVGKSTLINHWLRSMAADHYRSAELVFGWSFY